MSKPHVRRQRKDDGRTCTVEPAKPACAPEQISGAGDIFSLTPYRRTPQTNWVFWCQTPGFSVIKTPPASMPARPMRCGAFIVGRCVNRKNGAVKFRVELQRLIVDSQTPDHRHDGAAWCGMRARSCWVRVWPIPSGRAWQDALVRRAAPDQPRAGGAAAAQDESG